MSDLDWEIGTWRTRLSRLLHPLSGSTEWARYEGTTVVRKSWDGRANLVELEVDGPKGHIEALSLRLYNPETHQWSLNFANSRVGTTAVPAIGGFNGGRGEFVNPDSLDGPSDPRSIRDLPHHVGFHPFRAIPLGRWRQDLGGQLDCDGHAG